MLRRGRDVPHRSTLRHAFAPKIRDCVALLVGALATGCARDPVEVGPKATATAQRTADPAPNLPARGGANPTEAKPTDSTSGAAKTPESRPQSSSAETANSADSSGDLFDEAIARGVDYVNHSGGAAKATILEANGAGVAVLDLGNDGDLDLVFAQGLTSLEAFVKGPGADVEVFENDGRGHFTRIPGPGLSGWWTGLAVGDVDNDGDDDLVVAGFGDVALIVQENGKLVRRPNCGLEPRGDLRWVPGSAREKGHPPAWATSIALFDADRDGVLDLYVGQYLEFDPLAPPMHALGTGSLAVPCTWKGYEVFCGPAGLVPQPDRLLRGVGDGTFVDATEKSLLNQVAGFTLGVLPFDADGDGDTDVFVANDSSPNVLWINDGHGVFTDRAPNANVALSADGRAQAGMGVAAADVNRDGLVDFVVANFSDEPTELYFGSKTGFSRLTHRYGLQKETRSLLSWGVHLVDFDADGWMELVSANGHVYPQADREHTGTRYGQPATRWKLGPEPKAIPIAPSGPASIFAPAIGARGSSVGDLDRDGAPDLVLARIDANAAVGMNRAGRDNARLEVRVLGSASKDAATKDSTAKQNTAPRTPLDGHGARVIVVAGSGANEFAEIAECQTAAGYQSASSAWLHFGLAREREYRSIRILWPSGKVEDLPGGKTNARLVVREGQGVVSREDF